jgi:hypothetical protein
LRYQLNAPIEFDVERNGYYYTEPTFRLAFPQLSQGEMLALCLAERMMRQFRGTPFERDLRLAIDPGVESWRRRRSGIDRSAGGLSCRATELRHDRMEDGHSRECKPWPHTLPHHTERRDRNDD